MEPSKATFTRSTHARGIGGTRYMVMAPLTGVVRPFSSHVQHILDKIEKLRPIEGESQEARLCIGAPSNFSTASQPNVQIDRGDDDPEQEELPRYTEQRAIVRDVRVTNPEDDEQYVDITARNASLLRDDKGREFWIDWLQDLAGQQRAT